MLKRGILLSAGLFLCLVPAIGKDKWTKVQSKHFTLVGNAGEKEIRTVGTRLEQFRSIFSQVFPKAVVDSKQPIVVIVFKSKGAFQPFMPVRNGKVSEVAGYFQPGEDLNFIALTSEFRETDPYAVIFHEFVHALTNNTMQNSPVWLNEGIAEYYSTFNVTDKDTRVRVGGPISHRVMALRQGKILPLKWLFSVVHSSPEYNEGDKRGIFYAESWALVHYLLLADNMKRNSQFQQFVSLLLQGVPAETAFPKSFGTDFTTIEKELESYINRNELPEMNYISKTKLTFDDEMTASEISEAEANFFLGDLLAHERRPEAEKYLQTAVQLDPSLASAYASLALIRISTRNFNDALTYLEKAVSLDQNKLNHLIYFFYAQALMKNSEGGSSGEIDAARAKVIRSNLEKSMNIDPTFLPSYALVGYLANITGEGLDEAALKLKGILTYAPGNQPIALQLGQIYLHQQKFEEAASIFKILAVSGKDEYVRALSQNHLENIQRFKNNEAARVERASKTSADPEPSRPTLTRRQTEAEKEADPNPSKPAETRIEIPAYKKNGTGNKVTGQMTRLECDSNGVTVFITVAGEKKKFFTKTPDKLQFATYTQSQGEQITCGDFSPPRLIRLTFNVNTEVKPGFAGEPLVIEFLKSEDQ